MSSSDPPCSPAEIAAVHALIEEWVDGLGGDAPVLGVERVPGERRWLIRMRGDDKDVTTVWLTLGERTLRYETFFIPSPTHNVAECYEYLLRLNERLYDMRFAIGEEDAIYLCGHLPLRAVDAAELDHVLGASYAYTEQYFRAALTIAFGLAARGGRRYSP